MDPGSHATAPVPKLSTLSSRQEIRKWFLESVTPLAVVSAICYAVLRLSYYQFYADFGLVPEEVGIGRSQILTQLLVGPVVFGLLLGCTVALIYLALDLLAGDAWAPWPKIRRFRSRILLVTFLLGMLLAVIIATRAASSASRSVTHNGQPLESVRLDILGLKIPILDVRAVRLSGLYWRAVGPVPPPLAQGSRCLLFLGSGNAHSFFYDVRLQRLEVYQEGDVVPVLDLFSRPLPENCLPLGGFHRYTTHRES
jgi:hypothetical protein